MAAPLIFFVSQSPNPFRSGRYVVLPLWVYKVELVS